MSKESDAFLKYTHLLVNDTVAGAMHVLTGMDLTVPDLLGGVLNEKDIHVLRNLQLSENELQSIKLLLKAVAELNVTGVLSAIDGIVMSDKVSMPDLLLINRETGTIICDEFLNEEFFCVSEED
jgi:hypothetical protein